MSNLYLLTVRDFLILSVSHLLSRIRVKGGGRIAQVYAIRQALAKALVAFYQKRKSSCDFQGL